jgi:hypothetical protein
MIECTTEQPCSAGQYHHCGGHGQCDAATAYCDSNGNICAAKKENNVECAGHTSCLSDWCKDEGGNRFCAAKIAEGLACDGDQSVSAT